MEEIDDIEEFDLIDSALEGLLDEIITDDLSDDIADERLQMFSAIYADLVDDGEIAEAPIKDASDEEKQKWVDAAIPIILDRIRCEISGDSGLQ